MERSQAPQDSPLAAPLEEGVIHGHPPVRNSNDRRDWRLLMAYRLVQ